MNMQSKQYTILFFFFYHHLMTYSQLVSKKTSWNLQILWNSRRSSNYCKRSNSWKKGDSCPPTETHL